MSFGVGHRPGLDPALRWLQCRLAAAALIRPLGWEPPYAASVALKSKKKEKTPQNPTLVSNIPSPTPSWPQTAQAPDRHLTGFVILLGTGLLLFTGAENSTPASQVLICLWYEGINWHQQVWGIRTQGSSYYDSAG